VKELPKVLGAMSSLSAEERLQYYRDHLCKHPTSNFHARRFSRVRWLMEESMKQRFTTFLDIGCHDGFVTRWMVDEPGFQELVALDPSIDAIRCAYEALKETRCPEKAVYLSVPYEHFKPPRMFSGISAFELLEHFTMPEGVELLRYVHEYLEPGGRAYICTPNIEGEWGRTNPDPHHLTLYDAETLHDLIEATVGEELVWHQLEQRCPYLMVKWQKTN